MSRENNRSKSGPNTQNRDEFLRVAFLALGSIGDCLPLCALAASLQHGTVTSTVVTHSSNASCVRGEQEGSTGRGLVDR